MSFAQRTDFCGELSAKNVDQIVTVNGWAHKVRNLGGLTFVDVRDRTGIVQVIFPENAKIDLRAEFCLSVTGRVQMRDEVNRNPRQATGDIEVAVESHEVLNPCATLPFPISDEEQMERVNEELRVKYRYLDLRRPAMHRKIAVRAAAVRKIRAFMDEQGFIETETPIITKSTPEGARDYLVPYRLQPGEFYALPQSPQQYKQLLMVGGLERYYQIAKCFRDESQRADRQPEFTQLDLEMAFVRQDDILNLVERLTAQVCTEVIEQFGLDIEPPTEFPRITHAEAMRRFGNDKPDLRFGLELFDISDLAANSGFGVFKSAVESGGVVRGVRYPGGSDLSRKQISELEELVKSFGAKGLANFALINAADDVEGSRLLENGLRIKGGISKFLSAEEVAEIRQRGDLEPGDLVLFVADQTATVCECLSRLRLHVGRELNLRDPRKLSFAFIVDFPLVEWNADESRWDPSHHPFTSPKTDDLPLLSVDPGRVRADCYDIVCNGYEWGSGSIRIHRPEIQAQIFDLIGVTGDQQNDRFGHILEAFQMGAPPHGGIAMGIDRLVMFLLNEENIREVIAFPKMGNGYDPMMDAPSSIDEAQWQELGLQLRPSKS